MNNSQDASLKRKKEHISEVEKNTLGLNEVDHLCVKGSSATSGTSWATGEQQRDACWRGRSKKRLEKKLHFFQQSGQSDAQSSFLTWRSLFCSPFRSGCTETATFDATPLIFPTLANNDRTRRGPRRHTDLPGRSALAAFPPPPPTASQVAGLHFIRPQLIVHQLTRAWLKGHITVALH